MTQSNYTEELERKYQDDVAKLLTKTLDYRHLGNLQYAKGSGTNHFGAKNSPIIETELIKFLQDKKYNDYTIRNAIAILKDKARLSDAKYVNLADTNNAVYNTIISGVSVKPSAKENEIDVMFFDFERPENNNFAIAEEVSFIDPLTTVNSRPDIVVYVNGIALCVIELKRSIVSLDEGVRQHLSNERDLIPSFFTTTQFTVVARHAPHQELEGEERVTDEMYGFKYATLGTPQEFWCPWKEDTNRTGIVLSDEESIADFFSKEQFMFLFRYGIVADGGIKKVMRPHQYHALRAAEPRLKTKDSGVIWHSQGSGKSLTMVWLAAYIKDNFEDPRVVVITDRTELDVQLSGDFSDAGNNLHRATSQQDLLRTLAQGKEWLITTLIHKFGNHSDGNAQTDDGRGENKIPLDKYLDELRTVIAQQFPGGFKAKGKNIFIFVDECHRTQGGRLHKSMREIMGQDVMLIGFTGTPLLKDAKKNGYNAFHNLSELKFGEFIHKYLHKQAVEDKVILDLQYEAREVEQSITQKDKIDEKLEHITAGLSDERKALIKDRWATLEKVYSSSDRIERIGFSIIDDMESSSILRQDWANAMLVAGNIYSACRYYDFFQNKCTNTRLRGHVAVVTSYSPSTDDIRKDVTDTEKETQDKYKHDIIRQAYADAGLKESESEKYEAWAKKLFITQPGRMKLLIVVDKLLTGFDAPCATYLYIDKDMRNHTLFQAICRINRLGTDIKDEKGAIVSHSHKEYGLIVDFKHLFDNIENAITKFNDEKGGLGGFDEEDVEGLLEDNIAKNKKRLIAADNAFNALKAMWIRQDLTNNDLLFKYYITDFDGDPAEARRTVLYNITGALTSSYDNMADFMSRAGFSKEETDYYERQAREAAHISLYIKQRSGDIFDPRNYDPDMRALLDRYLRAEDAKVIVPATADFSFLDMIGDSTSDEGIINTTKERAGGNEEAAAEIIEAKARAVINNFCDRDPEAFLRFSERLQQLLDTLRKNSASFAERMRELVRLLRQAKSGGASFPEGISTQRQKAYWNNRVACGFSGDDAEALRQALLADELVENIARPNFRDPGSAHGTLFKRDIAKAFPNATEEQVYQIYMLAVQN